MKAIFKRTKPYQDDEMNLPVVNVDDSIPFYEQIMGFRVESRSDTPTKCAVLFRDEIRMGISENGEDPTQDGCFFEVNDAEATCNELKDNGLEKEEPNFRINTYGDTSYKIFFVVAPDDLCYSFGERIEKE